ncbi:C40 family peptidase [Mediterraneibacter agrestimuris]|uniref:C40 family peptidase n=1 Tax=Mediterraneibacter agrestimuris TaxID=2941333 RepID=UPI00203B46E9|nr:NlpC/P60 family protein [Mediterraneibacter agrestimuris]
MKNTRKKQQLIVSALVGAIMIPGCALTAEAAEEQKENTSTLPIAGIESVLEECYKTNVKENINLYMVPTKEGEYLNRAFSNVSEGDFAYIRNAPDNESDWVGKLYCDSTVTVLDYAGEWTKIQSGSVEGYVPGNVLHTGEEAKQRAQDYEKEEATVEAYVLNVRAGQGTDAEILTQIELDEKYEVTGEAVGNWYPVKVGEIDGWVSGNYINIETTWTYAESKEEEEQRIAQEEADKALAEALAADTSKGIRPDSSDMQTDAWETMGYPDGGTSAGQAVINFACQFIGNPYVWGGTSLTQGADCSGFVQSVYANFGISLPRTTYDMVNIGYEVSYDQAVPGDIVLYDGHVGLYMGDGNIVNAMNEVDGIGICTATYAPILTIRRVL